MVHTTKIRCFAKPSLEPYFTQELPSLFLKKQKASFKVLRIKNFQAFENHPQVFHLT